MRDWTDILGLKPTTPALPVASMAPGSVGDTSSRKNMTLLIQLRWIAVAGQVVTIAVVQLGLGISLPLKEMSLVIAALVALNLASLIWLRTNPKVDERGLLIALVLDVGALTVQLYFSGGAANPFIFLYILQVTLAAVLLDARSTWAIGVLACSCFAGLIAINRPIVLPAGGNDDLLRLYILGALVCFALDAGLLAGFVTRITRNLRERDAHLAAYRQHAIEEDHIVRMGLLASGAAHELGTPLSSLDVILGDWRHLPSLSADPDLKQEIEDMQAAVKRCKSIVTGILISSGEARGEAPVVTTINAFLNELVDDWRATRPTSRLQYSNLISEDISIVSDSALKQVIFNVLDNAFEASPRRMRFTAEREGETLRLAVEDYGPGFAEEMLAQFGKPYNSSKGRPGGGLGLFLVVNVVRKLGGGVSARNRLGGGAVVTIELPLETLMIRQEEHAQ